MDHGEDAWRVLTCAGAAQDETIINRIMLRFRPIAPKPVDGDGSSGSWKPEEKKGMVTVKRTKRKYVRVKKNIDYRKRAKKTIKPPLNLKEMDGGHQVAAISSDPFRGPSSKGSTSFASIDPVINNKVQVQDDKIGCRVVDRVVVETSVRLESVTDASIEALGLGSSDMERKRNLERDTCPGFISDGLNRVEWINDAYRKMACVRESECEVRVRLEVKEKLMPYVSWYKQAAAFTCWVRLQYTWQKDKCCSQMVPCDVWRMDFGGFAWRLDVQAALGLCIQSNIGK